MGKKGDRGDDGEVPPLFYSMSKMGNAARQMFRTRGEEASTPFTVAKWAPGGKCFGDSRTENDSAESKLRRLGQVRHGWT